MPNTTLYELLDISRERADEVAEWIKRLAEYFDIDQENAEVFACGWFAGKYAGVSEIFSTVQKEMDKREIDLADMRERESRYPPPDGYA